TGHVHSVRLVPGEISALVIGSRGAEDAGSPGAAPGARPAWAAAGGGPRAWGAALVGASRGRTLFEAAAAGREQSLQLEHVMTVDWEEPLIPPGKAVRRSCSCRDADRSGASKHVIALAYVFAAAIDDDPSLLLDWRGCNAVEEPREPVTLRAQPTADAWAAGPLPELGPARPLQVGSGLKRLGRHCPGGGRAG